MSESGVAMIVTFVIALAIVSPFAIRTIRRVLGERRERRPSESGSPAIDEGEPSADDIATVLAVIDGVATATEGPFEVPVPARPTVDGRPAPAPVVDAILRDAIRRSGLVVVTDAGGPDGRMLVLRRA